jgi:ABC-2 type transport system permease protein
MRALSKLTWVELKLYLREPVGTFFTLVFPLLLLFLFGSIYGNEPSDFLGGRGSVDNSVPGYLAIIIGAIGMQGIPINLASYREQGILRRYRATPLRPLVVLGAQVIVSSIIALIGIALLYIAGRAVYDLAIPSSLSGVALAVALSALSFFAIGFVLASVLPTARTAQAVGLAVYMPMMFISGAGLPRQMLPEGLVKFSNFLPLTHVVTLIQDLWMGDSWNLVSLAALAGTLVVGVVVAVFTFRWE